MSGSKSARHADPQPDGLGDEKTGKPTPPGTENSPGDLEPLTAEEQAKLVDEIDNLETELRILHLDLEFLDESLKYEPTKVKTPKGFKAKLREMGLQLARWAVDQPDPAIIENETKARTAFNALDLQQQIAALVVEREKKMARLDSATCRQIDEKSNVTRIKDFVAIRAVRLLEQATQKAKQEAKPEETNTGKISDKSFKEHLEAKIFSDKERKKLVEMVSDANYKRAVQAANELDPTCKLPAKGTILAELIKLPKERLKEICEIQEKPTLVIVPPNSFADKVTAMNEPKNKHYNHPQGQANANVISAESDSPYKNPPGMTKGKVSIVDGVVHPKAPQGVSNKSKERRDFYTAIFSSKGAKHIDKDEYAALMQMSLIEAKGANDNNKIIDNLESGSGTFSFIDPSTLTNSSLVAYGFFRSINRRVSFYADRPDVGVDVLRGRSSVQFFEFTV